MRHLLCGTAALLALAGPFVSPVAAQDCDITIGIVLELTGPAGAYRQAGAKAAEMALRLKYAGVPVDRLVVESDLARALDDATAPGAQRRVFALPTYTAMLALRDELVGRGAAEGSFAS